MIRREERIIIDEKEILKLGGFTRLSHTFERNAPTPTGIKMVLNGFYDEDGNLFDSGESSKRILQGMVEKGLIDDGKWYGKYDLSHRWGPFDDDGYGKSIYECKFIAYRFETKW